MAKMTLTPERPFPVRVEAALSRGELWRAKEILQGTIASSKYDPLLYEQYGLVLLQMNDLVEAGRYLFLSGQTKEEYKEGISLYLKRNGRRDWQTLVASFPRRAKKIPSDLFPQNVRAELERLQIPKDWGHELPVDFLFSPKPKYSDRVALFGCGCAVVLVAACFAAGVVAIFQNISNWFT